jgi:hypothetical protein
LDAESTVTIHPRRRLYLFLGNIILEQKQMAFSWFKKKKVDQAQTQPQTIEELTRKMAEWSKQKKELPQGADYLAVDSAEKAFAMYKQGELARVYLFPLAFGGQESEFNCVYVPHGVDMLKERFDELVVALYKKGAVTAYTAKPEYKGKSFVPSALILLANGRSGIKERIEIW